MNGIFGKIESIERDEEKNYLVHFDAAHFDEGKPTFGPETKLQQILSKMSKAEFKEISKVSNYRERWFRISTSQNGKFLARSTEGIGFTSHLALADGDGEVSRFDAEPIGSALTTALNRNLRAINREASDFSETALWPLDNGWWNIDELRVLNVGQGSAACGLLRGLPFFYFDVGGGFGWNRRTYPRIRTLEVMPWTWILLSHWDMDHFFSAMGPNNQALLNRPWFAPGPVPPRPTHVAFARKILDSEGRLYLWPHGRGGPGMRTCGGLAIARGSANSDNRNGSGLIMKVPVECGQCRDRSVLLTGDAEYHYIPQTLQQGNSAVVVPHHGGRMQRLNIPAPSLNAKGAVFVLSYGVANTYGHPVDTVVYAHQTAGWNVRYDTCGGDVVFRCKNGGWHKQN